jgi:hypothetical protein
VQVEEAVEVFPHQTLQLLLPAEVIISQLTPPQLVSVLRVHLSLLEQSVAAEEVAVELPLELQHLPLVPMEDRTVLEEVAVALLPQDSFPVLAVSVQPVSLS